jgi:hypothetical protein
LRNFRVSTADLDSGRSDRRFCQLTPRRVARAPLTVAVGRSKKSGERERACFLAEKHEAAIEA